MIPPNLKKITHIIFIIFVLVIGIYLFQFAYVITKQPNIKKLSSCFTTSMNKVNFCNTSHKYSFINNISQNIIKTLLISEDASFFHHQGFDWKEIFNSFKTNIKKGRLARGGSTITQQLVKNAFLSSDKTWKRKLKELLLTKKIEQYYSKKQILEFYLNMIEFAPAIYGVQAASQFFFQKTPSEITLLESALLTAILPNPKKFSKNLQPTSPPPPWFIKKIQNIGNTLYKYNKISQIELNRFQEDLDNYYIVTEVETTDTL